MILLRDGQQNDEMATKILPTDIGGMLPLQSEEPTRIHSALNQIQHYLVDQTRLEIPTLAVLR